MKRLKAIETEYKGYLFRSRLEARWAVFFDACGVEYEYEPQGYDLGGGSMYLPDFLLHGAQGRVEGDLYVEVKGKASESDAYKVKRFYELGKNNPYANEPSKTPILVVGPIPSGENMYEVQCSIREQAYTSIAGDLYRFNFETVDGDHFAAHPGIGHQGQFELFGDDSSYLCDMDEKATERAYRIARQARFEHGDRPRLKGGR